MVKKIVSGFVVQDWDEDGNFVSQEFISGDEVDWEDENGDPIEKQDFYQPYDMVNK